MDRWPVDDTLLIVNTDYGLLLGEHGWWAKGGPPMYNETPHSLFCGTPFLSGGCDGLRAQTIDLAPTILAFGIQPPAARRAVTWPRCWSAMRPCAVALYGAFGRQVNLGRTLCLHAGAGHRGQRAFSTR